MILIANSQISTAAGKANESYKSWSKGEGEGSLEHVKAGVASKMLQSELKAIPMVEKNEGHSDFPSNAPAAVAQKPESKNEDSGSINQ